MGAGLGMMGHVGFAKESSGGVAVAAATYVEALSEGFTRTQEYLDVTNIGGRLSRPDTYRGATMITGAVSMAVDPVTIGAFLQACFGPATRTVVLSGSLWTHAFKPPTDSSWDSRFAAQPYTFEIFRDVGSSQQYAGCNLNQLTISGAFNQALQAETQWLGISETDIAKTSPTFVSDPVDPLGFDTASISIGGAASAIVESFSIGWNNNLEAVGTMRNSREAYKIRRTDFIVPTLNMTIGFEDITDYLRFKNGTEVAVVANFFRAGSFSMAIDLPRVLYTAHLTGIGGRGRQTVEITGEVRYHVGSSAASEVRLTTNVASY